MEDLMEVINQQEIKLGKQEAKIKELEFKLGKKEESNIRSEMEKASYIVRLQNIPEEKREMRGNLIRSIGRTLVEYLQIQEEDIKKEIDQVYRVRNSYIKRQILPNEDHLKCVRQSFKEEIFQKAKKEPLRCQGQEIKIIKVILWKVRVKRKEYTRLK